MQYQAVPDQHQVPQGEQWVMPPWVDQVIDYVNKELNWLDFAFWTWCSYPSDSAAYSFEKAHSGTLGNRRKI